MARPLSGDIWHLSIDDLLAPLPESARLGGPGPFVINLSASTAPISQPIKGVVGCPQAHVYQIQRTEDRRPRYRLRLGPFSTEDEAEAVLEKVRDIYPSALTATAEAEDLRALEAIQAKITAPPKVTAQRKVEGERKVGAPARIDVPQPPRSSIPVLSEEVSLARPRPVSPPAPRQQPVQIAPAAIDSVPAPVSSPVPRELPPLVVPEAIDPARVAAPDEIPWVVEPPVVPAAVVKPSAVVKAPVPREMPPLVVPEAIDPAPVAAPDEIPWVVEPPVVPAAVAKPSALKPPVPKPSAVQPSVVRPAASKPPVPKPSAVQPSVVRPAASKPSAVPAAALKPPQQLETRLPSFESTQTIRPLTLLELEEAGNSSWFVIQLSIADNAFDPENLPNLDIFNVYRLYSVAGLEQGRVMHALRLGFFSDEIAASAVASYLSAFYQCSTVKRVSGAERERFADKRFEARKDIGATGQHAAIEITSDRVVRERRIAGAATPEKPADPPSAPRMGSQKSRWF